MTQLKTLHSLYKQKLFRIPDYQRGYSWGEAHIKAFWEDLTNLRDDLHHYTGVITLKKIDPKDMDSSSNEYQLMTAAENPHELYDIVDGQQRMITFAILLKSLTSIAKNISDNNGKADKDINISDSHSLEYLTSTYLFAEGTKSNPYRTYRLGYASDDPSYEYFKNQILNDTEPPSYVETTYTLNLKRAKEYFDKKLSDLYESNGFGGLQTVYKNMTEKLLVNEHVADSRYNIFVAFETINNRGKQLSTLELLKNRMIYLTTLYAEKELDRVGKENLRNDINSAWREVYCQLGRNPKHLLSDDDFLRAHWYMYFESATREDNFKDSLLNNHFSPRRIYGEGGRLDPEGIRKYVLSLKESAGHWFNLHNPAETNLSGREKIALSRLNMVGFRYFRPLILAAFLNEEDPSERADLFDQMERFIFIVFLLGRRQRDYSESFFHHSAYTLGKESDEKGVKWGVQDTIEDLKWRIGETKYAKRFYDHVWDKGNTYYGWNGLHYFLYEYERKLDGARNRNDHVSWDSYLTSHKDKISIEHILPQTIASGSVWEESFDGKCVAAYCNSIGNLLFLSSQENSSLQNKDFVEKKKIYEKGSLSEREVARNEKWTPEEIEERGLRLLKFMDERWGIDLSLDDGEDREDLLMLDWG